jgi:cbb3-type cytochrome oxidase subunit 3
MSEFLSAWWMWLVPLAFLAVVIYAFSPKRKKEFDAEARVPMESDDQPPGKG